MTTVRPSRVVIISDYSAVRGGASKLAMLQADLLGAAGVPVTVFAGDDGADAPSGLDLQAVGGRKLLDQGRVSAAVSGLWNAKARARLADWIDLNDCPRTVYHVHGYHQTLSPSVLAPLGAVRQRTVLHAHDYFLTCPNGAFFDFRAGQSCGLRPMSAHCIGRNCDKRSYGQKLWRVARQTVQNGARARLKSEATIVTIHRDMAARMFLDGRKSRIETIANPADPLLDHPVDAATKTDFLYVGDIHSYKGVEVLAQAGRQAGLSVRFAGDGQDRDALQSAYPEHRFDGWQDRAGLARILSETRVLVAPTLGPEPFGLAPVEALLSGIPVLMSDSMLLGRDVLARDIGATFRAGDASDLAQALRLLAADDLGVARMSRNAVPAGRALATSSAEWRDALLRLYGTILSTEAVAEYA